MTFAAGLLTGIAFSILVFLVALRLTDTSPDIDAVVRTPDAEHEVE